MKGRVGYGFVLVLFVIAYWLLTIALQGTADNGGWLLVLAVVWLEPGAVLVLAVRRMKARGWIYAGLLILAGLLFPTSMQVGYYLQDNLPQAYGEVAASAVSLLPSLALVVSAPLLASGVKLYQIWRRTGAPEGMDRPSQDEPVGREAAIALVLGALLLAKTLYNLYWLMIWDTTYDFIDYLWLIGPVLAVLFFGIVAGFILPEGTKKAALWFMLLLPVLMIAITAGVQRINFRQLTEERAGLVSRVIEAYYAREGLYPQDLQQLMPRYALSLPGLVILNGQSWCYNAGTDYYRLGYITKIHWSNPIVSGQLYKAEGSIPQLPSICDQEVAAIKNRTLEAWALFEGK